MKQLDRTVVKTQILGSIALFIFRALEVARFHLHTLPIVVKWLFRSKETTNHTYYLKESNIRHLACLISEVLEIDYPTIMGYFAELESNDELKAHIAATTAQSDRSKMADTEARFGRRIGWYAITRALKPGVIIETGVDKGLGACILTSALMKNRDEGYEGRYFGTDINPAAGYLLTGKYADFGEILYGDSIESLKDFDGPVDLFVNDSDHSAEYERREYVVVKEKLSESAIILGDNSDITDELLNFSLATGRRFVFFSEEPVQHWYPGGGIGISMPTK